MDGMEATARVRIREKLSGAHQTIIALTARKRPSILTRQMWKLNSLA